MAPESYMVLMTGIFESILNDGAWDEGAVR